MALNAICSAAISSIEAARAFSSELFGSAAGTMRRSDSGARTGSWQSPCTSAQLRHGRRGYCSTTNRISSIPTILRRYFFYGRGRYRLFRTNPRYFVELTNPIRPSALTSWRSYLAHPLLTIGVVFYKALTYGAGLAGLHRRGCARKVRPPQSYPQQRMKLLGVIAISS